MFPSINIAASLQYHDFGDMWISTACIWFRLLATFWHDHLKILFHIVSQQQGARHRRLVYSHVTICLAFAVGGCSLRFGPVDSIREAHCAAHQFRRSRHSAPLLSSPNGLSKCATMVFHFLLWFQIVFTLLSRLILRLWWHFGAPWWRRHGTGGGAVLLSFIGGLSKGAA